MKFICIGRNYVDHAKELNNPVPKNPLVFMKPSTAILLNNRAFYHPEFSNDIHYELEVVLKICKNGRHVQPQFADSYYEELTLGIDLTARDLQSQLKEKGHPWEIAKAFDRSAVIGDLVHKATLPDVNSIKFQMLKNGTVVQDGDTKDLIFSFNKLICYVSQYFTLHNGDMIFTGTPAGVGKIEIGDEFKGLIEGKEVLHCDIK